MNNISKEKGDHLGIQRKEQADSTQDPSSPQTCVSTVIFRGSEDPEMKHLRLALVPSVVTPVVTPPHQSHVYNDKQV